MFGVVYKKKESLKDEAKTGGEATNNQKKGGKASGESNTLNWLRKKDGHMLRTTSNIDPRKNDCIREVCYLWWGGPMS